MYVAQHLGDQPYTKIIKQQSQSLKCLLLLQKYQEDNIIRGYETSEEPICINGFEQQFRKLLNYYEGHYIRIRYFAASLQRELSNADVEIETKHMLTTQQIIIPVDNQINKKRIELMLMERRDKIPIINL
ncbi:hypothetical protein HZS_3948 [Henneguya salminicola]|nr:hypothetical protein HZS_3948 [Henneguya salminicola]